MPKKPTASRALVPRSGGALVPTKVPVENLYKSWVESLKENTRRSYGKSLLAFADWLKLPDAMAVGRKLAELGAGHSNGLVLEFRNALQQAKLAPGTINTRIAAIRSWTKFLRMTGILNWSVEIPRLRVKLLKDTTGPGTERADRVVELLEGRNDPRSRRDLAVILLLYVQGFRRGEVAGLDLEHLELEKKRLWVLGKGSNEREPVTLSEGSIDAIKRWLKVRGTTPGPLFKNFDRTKKGNGRLTDNGIWRVTTGYGLGRPHGLRHTAITTALNETNGDVRTVQKFSRHQSVEMLAVYDDARRDSAGRVAGLLDKRRRRDRD